MGKLILCSGTRTNRPYGFSSGGMRVYSMEELCYYLFQHIYLIEEELFCEELFDWIQMELKLVERAEKLRQLKRKNADIKTMVTVVLCSADYYTEYEIKSFLKELDSIVGMPRIKRNCIKADNYLKQQQYKEAEAEYERLLAAKEAVELTPEDYGDILHNLAIAKLHTVGYRSAAWLFEQAYNRNQKEETLHQYLYALQLISSEEEYLSKLIEYQVSDELRTRIEDLLQIKKEEAMQCNRMAEIQNLRQNKLQGHMNEFYRGAEEMIESWKGKLRQI